jgi:amino ABC transporter, permease protein, 3-TM region, his/glu/gln/arg/opine family
MKIYEDFYKSVIYDKRYLYILEGLKNTLLIALGAVVIGVIIGLIVAIIRDRYDKTGKGKISNFIASGYVTIIRGTPALVQLMIIYYVIFKSISINLVLVGILSFGINSGAYVSEIMRAGFSLGLGYNRCMKYIILPQAIKNILPALGNEFITLVKETSVAGYIGIVELTKASDIIASNTYNYFFPLIITALIYLFITSVLAKILGMFERKFNHA